MKTSQIEQADIHSSQTDFIGVKKSLFDG